MKKQLEQASIFDAASTLTNFGIQKCHWNKTKFNGVYSRTYLAKVNHGAYVIDLDNYKSIGTHWIATFTKNKAATYFDSFGVEYIVKLITKSIGSKIYIARSIYHNQYL